MNKLLVLTFIAVIIFSCSNSDEDFSCEVIIPIEASEGDADLNGTGSQVRYVTKGDTVTSSGGGSNEYYIEAGGYVISEGGGGLLFYVKNNGRLDISGGGGSINIIREEDAIVNNTLQGGNNNDVSTCESIIFERTQLEPVEVSILDSYGIGSKSLNDTDDNIQYVRNGDVLTNTNGDKNTYYIESGGQVTQSGGSRHLAYVKSGGILNISGDGGSITIYGEPGAIVNNTLSGDRTNYYRECQSIIFDLPELELCEIEIPANTIRGSGEVRGSNKILYVEELENVTSNSNTSNTFYIESGGTVTQDGGVNHVVHIKRNGTLNILGNSSMTINYEEGAIINRNDKGNLVQKRCSEVVFASALLEPCEIDIPDDAITGSEELNSASNIRHVLDGDFVSNTGTANTYYIESGGTVTQTGGSSQTIYVKNNGTINISGSNTSTIIHYEEGAILNRTELGSVRENKCSEIIFN